jgi:hypothetical protein
LTRSTIPQMFFEGMQVTIREDVRLPESGTLKARTKVEIVGFAEYCLRHDQSNIPGFYNDVRFPRIRTGDGIEAYCSKDDIVPHGRSVDVPVASHFLRPLPRVLYLYDDKVLFRGQNYKVHSVKYNDAEKDLNGNIYEITNKNGRKLMVAAGDLTLVERGPIWNFHNGIPHVWDHLQDEAAFHRSLDMFEIVSSEGSKFSIFDADDGSEAVRLLQSGRAHGFWSGIPKQKRGGMTDGPCMGLIRYDDEDLGERVRQSTLIGLGIDLEEPGAQPSHAMTR